MTKARLPVLRDADMFLTLADVPAGSRVVAWAAEPIRGSCARAKPYGYGGHPPMPNRAVSSTPNGHNEVTLAMRCPGSMPHPSGHGYDTPHVMYRLCTGSTCGESHRVDVRCDTDTTVVGASVGQPTAYRTNSKVTPMMH
eukprot:GHVO01059523.1.p2 GENE.GHVO01059523.1~~GHVO01059523.1.p2  ORF type:complete len:149 (+),score=8.25 GHVO01059523.1:28-447(+)